MQFNLDTAAPLEVNIRRYLTLVRVENPEHYRVLTFSLYTELCNALTDIRIALKCAPFSHYYKDGEIPIALFNKTIGDLKKVGIIGTCKGGEEVFLSDFAWELYQTKRTPQAPIDTVRAPRRPKSALYPFGEVKS